MDITVDWTDAQIASLRTLFAAGLSASQIGDQIGRSRPAVCGKLNRLGLKRGRASNRPRKAGLQPPYRQAMGLSARLLRIKRESFEPRTDNIVDLPPDQSDCAVPFMKLGPQHCRWPLEDRFYCGAAPWPGRPYCARHCCLAYRQPKASVPHHASGTDVSRPDREPKRDPAGANDEARA